MEHSKQAIKILSEAIAQQRLDAIDAWENSTPEDADYRERLFHHISALKDVQFKVANVIAPDSNVTELEAVQ